MVSLWLRPWTNSSVVGQQPSEPRDTSAQADTSLQAMCVWMQQETGQSRGIPRWGTGQVCLQLI